MSNTSNSSARRVNMRKVGTPLFNAGFEHLVRVTPYLTNQTTLGDVSGAA